MTELITIKWNSFEEGEVHKSKLPLQSLFPQVDLTYSNKLYLELALTIGRPTNLQDRFVRADIRLPGSKEYQPLSALHLEATRSAGRARLRFVLIDGPIPAVAQTGTFTDTILQAILEAGSSNVKSRVRPAFGGLGDVITSTNMSAPVKLQSVPLIDVEPSTPTMHCPKSTVRPTWASNLVNKDEVSTLITTKINEVITGKMNEIIKTIESRLPKPQKTGITPFKEHKHDNFKHNALCDSCDAQIMDFRFKCLDCPDFDLCNNCWQDTEKAHASHRFIKIKDEAVIPARKPKGLQLHMGVLCDGPLCKTKKTSICGIRYKCTMCEDYDLCASCEALPDHSHNETHPMLKMKTHIEGVSVSVMNHTPASKSCKLASVGILKQQYKDLAENAAKARQAQMGRPNPLSHLADRLHTTMNTEPAKWMMHPTIACDTCDKTIQGIRFMCATCDDFDLCEACYKKAEHDRTHVFVEYKYFVNHLFNPRLKFEAVPELHQHNGFYCDECKQSPIQGKRYNCLTCTDHDRCEDCAATKDHPKSHVFKIIPAVIKSEQSIGDEVKDAEKQIDTPVVKSEAVETTPDVNASIDYSAEFVEDITIKDGSIISPGSAFTKSWLLINDGETIWPAGTTAVHVGGKDLTIVNLPSLAAIAPGQSATLSLDLQAPIEEQDNLISYWRLVTPDGTRFGCKLWIDIDIHGSLMIFPDANQSNHSSSPSQRAQEWGSDDEVSISDDDDYELLDDDISDQ